MGYCAKPPQQATFANVDELGQEGHERYVQVGRSHEPTDIERTQSGYLSCAPDLDQRVTAHDGRPEQHQGGIDEDGMDSAVSPTIGLSGRGDAVAESNRRVVEERVFVINGSPARQT